MPDDEFLRDRVLWRASQHSLPARSTFLYEDVAAQVREVVENSIGEVDLGHPVLLFLDFPSWTVVGTRAVVSRHLNQTSSCAYREIVDFSPTGGGLRGRDKWAILNAQASKPDLELLLVHLRDSSSVRLWGPKGEQLFALWNILLMLAQMSGGDAT